MIEKSLGAGGAATRGVYGTEAADMLAAASPQIGELGDFIVEIEGEEPYEDEAPAVAGHDDNLVDSLPESELLSLANELLGHYDRDVQSREPWEKTLRDGLRLLGLKDVEVSEPWQGASNVFHPMLAEAVVRFQAETITETFPAQGPVKTQVIGKATRERLEAAERVREDMNWRLTDQMPEYRTEHERMLWNLAVAGSAFKKTYFDETMGRQVSMFVPAEDFIVNYGAANLETCDRYTHRLRRHKTYLLRMQEAKVYSTRFDLGTPSSEIGETQDAKDKIVGVEGSQSEMYDLLEMHVDLTIEGKDEDVPKPYVVTINKTAGNLLAIRRNWAEDDPAARRMDYFTHYQYVVGFGFYGFGLLHLIGGHAKSATSLLRQLIDAGTLSNLPGGFKTRDSRILGNDEPLRPGEFRDVDTASGDVKNAFIPLPYKEPSAVLAGLLDKMVDDARRFAAITDTEISGANQNAPVGTTLALIERELKVLTAVQARVHAAMRVELKLLKQLVRDNGERDYPYEIDDDKKTKDEDYAIVEILPVSDPNAATMGVKVAQYQAVMQLAEKDPQLYDKAHLHREMISVLGLKNIDKIIPAPAELKPRDPVSENMAILMTKPVKAHMHQDHKAHIAVHQAFMQDPKLGMLLGQNPNAQGMFNALQAHIAEHAAYQYRDQIQIALGVTLPDPNEEMPPAVEFQVSALLAQAAMDVNVQNTNEMKAQQAQQAAQDPLTQIQMRELAVKEKQVAVQERDVELKHMEKDRELKLKSQDQDAKQTLEVVKIIDGQQQAQADRQFKAEEGAAAREAQSANAAAERDFKGQNAAEDRNFKASEGQAARDAKSQSEDKAHVFQQASQIADREFQGVEAGKGRLFDAMQFDAQQQASSQEAEAGRQFQAQEAEAGRQFQQDNAAQERQLKESLADKAAKAKPAAKTPARKKPKEGPKK